MKILVLDGFALNPGDLSWKGIKELGTTVVYDRTEQARILNREGTDLNVIVGLCVGHDTLFIKHSEAPVTCLIVKDRVLAHNPAAALYASGSYYKRLLSPETVPPRSR